MRNTARTNKILSRIFAATMIAATLSGCASDPAEKLYYASQPQLCRSGDAPSCITKQGKAMRCFCADKEALRELLDPDAHF